MDKNCSIVQDLLPLYAEDMVREETKEFVAGHLSQCETCRAELSALKADVTPAPVSAQPLRDLKKQLQRKRLTAVLLAVSLALTLATAAFAYLTAPQYLPYDGADWSVIRLSADGERDITYFFDDGRERYYGEHPFADRSNHELTAAITQVDLILQTPVSGTKVECMIDPDSGQTIYFITAWRTLLDEWLGNFDAVGKSSSIITLDTTNCKAVYYAPNNGTSNTVLCGSIGDGGVISLPRLALGYYVLLSLVFFIALGIAAFLCRGKKAGRPLACLALIPASYLAGHLLVKGFTLTSYQMQRDFSLIILAAALVYAAVLLAASLRRQKQEKN